MDKINEDAKRILEAFLPDDFTPEELEMMVYVLGWENNERRYTTGD
jgi:hypothetical protein